MSRSLSLPSSLVQWTRNVAAVAGAATLVASIWTVAGHTAKVVAQSGAAAHAPAPALALFTDVPSHDELYRASLIPAHGQAVQPVLGRAAAWTVEVRTAAGAPVEGATLQLESWMPEEERVVTLQPRVTAELGGGRYRVEGLRFDRAGWWNVKLAVAAPMGTDSLAFNLVH